LVSALGMAVGYTRWHTERFAREAIRTEQSPVVSQTAPDDVTDDARDAARLELACVKTWVKEEDTRESVRATTRFPHDGEAVIKPDVLETGIDIRTVAVTELVRETTRFPYDSGTITGPDVLKTEVDIRTVASQ
jgi:hypothetical protein